MIPNDERMKTAGLHTSPPMDQKYPDHFFESEWRAAPFSEFLGLPTLSHQPAKARLISLNTNASFGMKLLSDKQTPLSSLLRLPVLKAWKPGKTTSFGLPLLSKQKG